MTTIFAVFLFYAGSYHPVSQGQLFHSLKECQAVTSYFRPVKAVCMKMSVYTWQPAD